MASLFYFPSALEREKRGRNFFSLSLDGSRQNCPFSLSFCRSLRQLFFLQSLPLFFPLSFLFLPLSPMFLIPWLLLSLLLFVPSAFLPLSSFWLAALSVLQHTLHVPTGSGRFAGRLSVIVSFWAWGSYCLLAVADMCRLSPSPAGGMRLKNSSAIR